MIKRLDLATKQYVALHPRTVAAQQGTRENPKAIAAYENEYAAKQKLLLDQLSYLRCLDALSTDKSLRKNIQIHIRIYTTIEGHRLDLVRSEPEKPVKK